VLQLFFTEKHVFSAEFPHLTPAEFPNRNLNGKKASNFKTLKKKEDNIPKKNKKMMKS
jgi:hypothetical protein